MSQTGFLFLVCLSMVGLYFQQTNAQATLTTKCPTYWTKLYERCYVAVNYNHSYTKALSYCQIYGAGLAVPAGFIINDAVASLVHQEIPTASMYRIGYNLLPSTASVTVGFLSNGQATSVDVGNWDRAQPDINSGDCSYVSTSNKKWSIGSCDTLMPFVCEMDPCPVDRFMCNGKCIGSPLVCDEKDDCGNNMDEQDCEDLHTSTLEESSATIQWPPPGTAEYSTKEVITWTIITKPGSRINLKVISMLTEDGIDFVEYYDGGPDLDSSVLVERSSGNSASDFTTSYNFLILRFVSDNSNQYSGFEFTYSTDHECKFVKLSGYTFSNTEISDISFQLGPRLALSSCESRCTGDCFGFSYNSTNRRCYFFNNLPALLQDSNNELHTKTCPIFAPVTGSMPMLPKYHTAGSGTGYLSTVRYPNPYIGNFETEYVISTQGNRLITLKVVTIDLCCGDFVYIYDKAHELLETLNSDSTPHVILSTGNLVYVRMVLHTHNKCKGVLLEYTRDCDLTYMYTGTDMITSPGYGTSKSYPNLALCTWRIIAPSTVGSMTLRFDDFEMASGDTLTLASVGSTREESGTSLNQQSITFTSHEVNLTLRTSSTGSGRGFSMIVTSGCSVLDDSIYVLSSNSFNYGDSVTVSCPDGFFFSSPFSDVISLELNCQSEGIWSVPELPDCVQSFCGPGETVENGFVESSTGVQGGNMMMYGCNDGFTLEGSAQVKCQANGKWEQKPQCISPQCQAIDTLATTTASQVVLRDGTDHGSVAKLSCDDNKQEINGGKTLQCDQGSWDFVDDTPSVCTDKYCETPLIANGTLSPDSPYTLGQDITVDCLDGFDLKGLSTFQCGMATNLPECISKTCQLGEINNLATAAGTFPYGTSLEVSCVEGFELDGVSTTSMTLMCEPSGWDRTPVCIRKRCGEPYEVFGSQYIYSGEPCTDYGCTFTFTCRPRYYKFGASSQGDVVTCGLTRHGLWDFGNLCCKGGLCPDPGYPGNGSLAILDTVTFQEGSKAMYTCNEPGFTLKNKDGTDFTGLTCFYNSTSGKMEWDGEVPQCKDTQPPTFSNCPAVAVRIELLQSTTYTDVSVVDNNYVTTWITNPDNTNSGQIFKTAQFVSMTAKDPDGNTAFCSFSIVIPRAVTCRNEESTDIDIELSSGQTSTTISISSYYIVYSGARVHLSPPDIDFTVTPDAATLSDVREYEITAYEGDTPVDSCTLQFRFKGSGCASWVLDMPNSVLDCDSNPNTCVMECEDNYYFMESPTSSFIPINCLNNLALDRDPPVCALATESYVIYTVTYNIEYNVNDGIGDVSVCNAVYEDQIDTNLESFASAMVKDCTEEDGSGNSFIIVLRSSTLTYQSQNMIRVRFQFQITLQDESASNTQTMKDTCANSIQSKLNIASTDIMELSTVAGKSASGCGPGNYNSAFSTSVAFEYDCLGNRKFFNNDGTRLCMECDAGHHYSETDENCIKCPSGTYGMKTPSDGTTCQACPDGKDPGITGLTSVDGCNNKDLCGLGTFSVSGLAPCTVCPKNFYSAIKVSRTCTECESNEITETAGSVTGTQCLTQQMADDAGVPTPCTNNRCQNGGTCSLVRHDYFCTCLSGFTGRTCDTNITACSGNPCQNGHACTVSGSSFVCSCNINANAATEFNGTLCENDRAGCYQGLCNNNGTCHNKRGGYSCKCPIHGGYENGGSCDTEIDQCMDYPCDHGVCVPHGSCYRSCACNAGYTGHACDTNIDDCDPNPCQNGGICTDDVDSFTCSCAVGYHGDRCQYRKACDVSCSSSVSENCNTCMDTGLDTCINIGNSYKCNCKEGYTGTSCQVAISACNSYPCQHGGECNHVSATMYTCSCAEPWTGTNCEMEKINCPDGSDCCNGGELYSTPSGYRCKCPYNYIGNDCSVEYDLCTRNNPCLIDGSVCSVAEDGTQSCNCAEGFTGDYCQTQVPSCATTVCANGGVCSDTGGSVTCTCVAGYAGSTCEDNIDECASNSCTENQECVDGINGYTCICAFGKRGDNCAKDYSDSFDYIIKVKLMCLEEASMLARFGDGQTPINAMTIAFWERFTNVAGDGVIISLFGYSSNVQYINESPEFMLSFEATQVKSYIKGSSSKRKKRATETMPYGEGEGNVNIADGRWHLIALAMRPDTGLINLYVDGLFKTQLTHVSTLGTRWFFMFGAFNTATGKTQPDNSFQGRISQVLILDTILGDTQISQLYQRSSVQSYNNKLPQQNLVQQYSVVFPSELDNDKCIPSDSSCQGLSRGVTLPTIGSCPPDTLTLTARGASPTWPEPTFTGASGGTISIMVNGDTPLDWGVYGISYAASDGDNNAAVCTFRLFNYKELTCRLVHDGNTPTSVDSAGGKRYQAQCPSGRRIAGNVPLYQPCNMYMMWDGEVQYNYSYAYPVCSPSTDVTAETSLVLDVAVTGTDCTSVLNAGTYRSSVLSKLTALNTDVSGGLCPENCIQPVADASFTCVQSALLRIEMNFGLIKPSMTYDGTEITPEEALIIAAGDRAVFTHQADATHVYPDVRSLAVTSQLACTSNHEVSGDKCVQCEAGTAYNNGVCERCAVGHYLEADTAASACTSCHPSYTTQGTGSTSDNFCKAKCILGEFYNLTSDECSACAIGYYQDSVDGVFACKPCGHGLVTASTGSRSASACVSPSSITTASPAQPVTGAATEGDTGLSVGVIVVIVLVVLIVLVILIFFLCFCCCRDVLPCFKKQKQIVAPTAKEGYYANKYGAHNMQFVSYNLRDVREKKGRPMDKVPIVDHPLSDETGSVKTDISVHVPVFNEKMDGKVKRKSLYMSNGGNYMNSARTRSLMSSREPTPRTYDHPMTSSPRDTHYSEVQEEPVYVNKPRSKKRRRRHKDRSGERSHRSAERSHRRSDYGERSHRSRSAEQDPNVYDEIPMSTVGNQVPKALAPMPHRIKSLPAADAHLRPLSPLDRPRAQVEPNEYQHFLHGSPKRPQRSNYMSRSYDDDFEPPETTIQRIEVESDQEDLR